MTTVSGKPWDILPQCDTGGQPSPSSHRGTRFSFQNVSPPTTPSDLHGCRTSASVHCILQWIKSFEQVTKFTHVKSAYIARDQFLCATTNSVVSDPPQISAICDVVAQLIYLPNSRSVYMLTTSRSMLLGTKKCDWHQKKQQHHAMQHQHGTPLVTPHLLFRIQISSDLGHRHFAGCAKLCTYSGLCLKFFGKGLDSIIFVFL